MPTTIRTIDAHTAGEPLRLIVEGFPTVAGTHDAREAGVGGGALRPSADGVDARAARPRRHVRRAADRAGAPGLRCWRALHAQPGLQHDVRPRRDRRGHAGDRARADRAAHARTSWCSTRPPARFRLPHRSSRADDRTRVTERQLSQRALVRAARRRARCGSDRARCRPTSPSAAPSTPSSTARQRASRSQPSDSTICGARAWRSSTTLESKLTIAHPEEPRLHGHLRHDLHRPGILA